MLNIKTENILNITENVFNISNQRKKMHFNKTEEKLMEYMGSLEIIDAHEHLPPEADRVNTTQDVFTLVGHYTRHDLFSAGMDWETGFDNVDEPFIEHPIYQSLFDQSISLEKRWATLKPYWERIKFGSYARAALITAKKVYGFDDINDDTYKPLSDAIASANKPGIYKHILCDMCNIKVSLTQCGRIVNDVPLKSVMPAYVFSEIHSRKQLEEISGCYFGELPANLGEYESKVKELFKNWKTEGAVGFKIRIVNNMPPDIKSAEKLYSDLLAGKNIPPVLTPRDSLNQQQSIPNHLSNYLLHKVIDFAEELDLPVAVHAGIWGDFRELDSKFMLTLAPAHPRVKFDLYHLGSPSIRDTIVIGKNLPNVFLNLCWTHIISQTQTQSGIDELLDQVPVNKIIAFGGDYSRPVEKVVGHLEMAREDFAIVFARRIERGLMGLEDAKHILKLWFYDNPVRIYNLKSKI